MWNQPKQELKELIKDVYLDRADHKGPLADGRVRRQYANKRLACKLLVASTPLFTKVAKYRGYIRIQKKKGNFYNF